jgi:hypothetical protein
VSDGPKSYPDNSAIFARKEAGRRHRAALSFAEKLIALDELKARTDPIVQAREERKRVPTPLVSNRPE